jgi:hypothetical protein
MKKFAVCVALEATTTGAMQKERKPCASASTPAIHPSKRLRLKASSSVSTPI